MAGRGPRPTSSVVTPYAAPPVESDSESDETPRAQQQQTQLQSQSRRDHRGWINDEEWIINITAETSNVPRLRSPSDVSIFRVPGFLKESREGAYVPKIVSLGPYHRSNEHLSAMNKHKERALSRMMTRFNINNTDGTEFSSRAKEEILQLENEIRKTYEAKIDFDAETFALDGCFILEILRTLGKEKFPVAEAGNYYEPIFERYKIDHTGFHIFNDILMLENQIPLIVLRKLLELELKPSDNVETKIFEVLVKSPRSKFYPFKYDMKNWSLQLPQQQQQVHHLLGLLHGLIVSPPFPDDGINGGCSDHDGAYNVRRIPRAVDLRNAGIKFERCLGGIKKIKFEKKSATIYLPPIQITDYTEVLFRNLIALELCKACKTSKINYVTCYLSLMDELIDSEEDVAVLKKSEIITNYLGSDTKVAELFNALFDGVTVSRRDAFQELKGQVYEHYKSKFQVWSAELVKEYFSSPWKSLALAGAILALLLTALQTIYSVIGVYK